MYRLFFYHYTISEKWGGINSVSNAFVLLSIEIGTLIWAAIYFIKPLGTLIEMLLASFLSLIIVYFMFLKNEKYEEIINNQKEITVLERICFFIIRIAFYLLLYGVALSSLNRLD